MNIRIWDKKGNSQEVQHFDVAAWIENGWLTSEPDSPSIKPVQSPPPIKEKNKN